MTFLEILAAVLGDYYPVFQRRLKARLPRSVWVDISRKKAPVPAEGTEAWAQLKAEALVWLVEGARLVSEEARREKGILFRR